MNNSCTVLVLLFLSFFTKVLAQAPRLVVPVGHVEEVSSVAFSPDGKFVLTVSGEIVKLWDLSGKELQSFQGHTESVTSVAFSPEGKTILTGSEDGTVKLWNLSGQELKTFSFTFCCVKSVAFSPDGKTILAGYWNKTAKLWDLSGKELMSFDGHADAVNSVAFSPDGKAVLTGSSDKTAKLWDLSGRELKSFNGNTEAVHYVAFSPDGKTILTVAWGKTAKLWDLLGRELQSFVSGHKFLAFSHDWSTILMEDELSDLELRDYSGKRLTSFYMSGALIESVVFSPNGRTILTGVWGKKAILWDFSGRILSTFGGHASDISSVKFSPDGKTILIGRGWDGTVSLWDMSVRGLKSFFVHISKINSVAFSPDGKAVLTGSSDKTAKLWDLSGRELKAFGGHTDDVTSVAFSPDGKHVLTGSSDKTAKLWDLSGRELKSFGGYTGDVTSVAFSPDGKHVLTSWDDTAKMWDLSGREIQSFVAEEVYSVESVAFSPDGKHILAGGAFNEAVLWDLSSMDLKYFDGFGTATGSVISVAFSPDGRTLLTGSDDKEVKLWDVSDWEMQSFVGHTSSVNSVAFSPDGKIILTGSSDNTTKLWDPHSGKELATLIALDSTDWVVTTPSGLFDASPGAMKLMHYVQGLEVIELDQLKERYYEPGLLAKVMGFDKSGMRDVAAFDQVALYPEINANIDKNLLSINLTERNGGLGKLSLFINGKEVKEDLNLARQKKLSVDLNDFAKYYRIDAPNSLALRAYNQEGWLKSQAYELTYQPAPQTKGEEGFKPTKPIQTSGRPSLYAVVVGTSNYAGEELDLSFADQDAESISQALQGACSALFGQEHTSVQLFSTSNKTPESGSGKANIQKAFQQIASKAKPEDVLLVYFSGHGLAYGPAEKEQFYYLTKDIGSQDLSDPVIRNNYTVSSEELTQWLTSIPAQKQVMVIDACNAGKVVESLASIAQKNLDPSQIRALDRMKDRTGMFILTGSAADKVSYEASQYGQGLLTYSLLQGMSGLALTDDKRVDVMKLFQYSRDVVPELARGIGGVQVPVLAFPLGEGASFDIGIVNSGVKIPLAQPKPVFIRSVFQDENFGDELELVKALEDYFRRTTLQGASARLIYSDVSEYESGYSIRGGYTITENDVEVKGGLYKGKTLKGKFQVAGKKDDVPGLVKQILQAVMPLTN